MAFMKNEHLQVAERQRRRGRIRRWKRSGRQQKLVFISNRQPVGRQLRDATPRVPEGPFAPIGIGAALISCAPATPPGVRVRTVKPLLGFDRIHQVEPDKALRDALQACALHAPALRRVAPEVGHPVHRQVWHVVPMLLDQLTRTLAAENDDKAALSIAISGRSGGDSPAPSETG